MTNREQILEDLRTMPAEAFFDVVWGAKANNHLDRMVCKDCRATYDGPCPEDEPCPITPETWLDKPCQHRHLLTRKNLAGGRG
jgi:hypothetical protein